MRCKLRGLRVILRVGVIEMKALVAALGYLSRPTSWRARKSGLTPLGVLGYIF